MTSRNVVKKTGHKTRTQPIYIERNKIKVYSNLVSQYLINQIFNMKKYLLLFVCLFTANMMFSQTLTSEDFNSGLPSDWSIDTKASDGGWIVGNAAQLASSYWPVGEPADGSNFIATNDDGCNCDKSEDRLILPTMDLSAVTGSIFFSYDIAFIGATYGGATESLSLDISYDGGTTWENYSVIEGLGSVTWGSANADLSALAGNASVTLSFLYNDDGGWVYGAALDNITLKVPPPNDISLIFNPDAYRFADISNGFDVSGIITNIGGDNLTSIDLMVTEGANTYNETLSGLDIAPFETTEFSINIPIAAPTGFSLDVTASNPNGEADADDTNNTDSFEGVGVENAPDKMIFVEESTGTWCPWCPRGAVFMDLMEEEISEVFAGVAVHVGVPSFADPMEIAGDYPSTYASMVGGFPTLLIDRSSNPGIPGINDMSAFGQELVAFTNSRPSPIGLRVDAEINPWTREMAIDLNVTAHSNIDGDFTVMLLITEDHVTGDGFDYRQANNYANNGAGPMGGWELLANPASGNDIEFSHTLREAIGGFTGLTGIIPATLVSGESYSSSEVYTIPAEFNMEELNIVVVVLDQGNGGAAYNSHIDRDIEFMTSSIDEITNLAHFRTFPNPVADNVNIELGFSENVDFQIFITDALGNKVKSLGQYSESNFRTSVDVSDLTSGVYSLSIMTKDGQNVSKFVKI